MALNFFAALALYRCRHRLLATVLRSCQCLASTSWLLRRAISSACRCSTPLRSWAARAFVRHPYSCDSCSPSSLAAWDTPTFSARNSGPCCLQVAFFFSVGFDMMHLCCVVYSLNRVFIIDGHGQSLSHRECGHGADGQNRSWIPVHRAHLPSQDQLAFRRVAYSGNAVRQPSDTAACHHPLWDNA